MIITMGGDIMLENTKMQCPEILICLDNPYTNGGFILDRMRVDIDILRTLDITKYIKAVRYDNGVWLSISRIYWRDIINICNDMIIEACHMVVSIHDWPDEINKDEGSETIDIIINMIRVISDIAHNLQYIIDNFDDEASTSVFIDMSESDRISLGIRLEEGN
jgi:hypothetical protein